MAEAVDADTGSPPSDEYECKICYDYFDLGAHTPKLLSCSHTFCQQCLDALHFREGRGWRVGCPVCRQRTPVPDYQVRNLPDNTALAASLPLQERPDAPPRAETRTRPAAASPARSDSGYQACKRAAFVTACVCAILSFLCMVVLLFLGLIFVHNLSGDAPPLGAVCLFVSSLLALLSLILTWLMCVLKYRPETQAGHFSSISSTVT